MVPFYRLLKLFVILCKFIVDNFCGDKFVGSFHLLGISSVVVDFRKNDVTILLVCW